MTETPSSTQPEEDSPSAGGVSGLEGAVLSHGCFCKGLRSYSLAMSKAQPGPQKSCPLGGKLP